MLWLVRHGESEANAGRITSDFAKINLTALGWKHAQAVAAACHVQPQQVVLSPYVRARQTAEPLLLKFPDTPVLELAVEEFTYLTSQDCINTDSTQRQPMVDAFWARMDPEHRTGAGAESFSELRTRANSFLMTAQHWSGVTVVFTHEQFIRALMLTAIDSEATDLTLMRRFFALRTGMPIRNGAIVRLDYREDRWWVGGIDATHLAD